MKTRDDKTMLPNKKTIMALGVLYVLCAILFVLDFVVHRESHLAWEELPGFYALFGLIAGAALVIVARGLRFLLKREKDYYDVD